MRTGKAARATLRRHLLLTGRRMMAASDRTADPPVADGDVGHLAGRGALWGVIAQVTQQLLSVAATMVLARLLTPADFGVVTASVTILLFVQLALALGWGAAIVRRPEASTAYLSTVFWVVTGTGTAMGAVMALGAPFLASLVGVSSAAPYLVVLALSCIPGAAVIVPQSILQRRLQLQAMHATSIVGFVAYALVQVVLALLGFGAWAVIVGMVVQSSVQLAGACVAARWLPRPVFRWQLIAADFRFAGGLLFNNGLTYGVRNADYLVVGKLLGAPALGAYYVAYVLPQILRLRVTWVTGSVMFPVLARSRTDPQRTQQVYGHTLLLLAWIGFPAMVGLAVLAEPVVEVFFGPQWDAAAAPLRWLAFVALLEFVTFAPPMVAQVHGRIRLLLLTNVVRLVLLLASVTVAGITFKSIGAVAAGVFVATLLWAIHQQLTLARPLGLAFAPLVPSLAALAALSCAMGIAVGLLLVWLHGWPAIVQLSACTVAGMACYLVLGRLLFGRITSPLFRSVRTILHSGGATT
jgi:O-antigen/teichoic acid export membrane protein